MTELAARVSRQFTSARAIRSLAAPAGIVAGSLALGWILAERGPMLAFLPLALCGAIAVVFAALTRPLHAVLALVAVISAFPVARIVVGEVPIYVTDVLAALALTAVYLQGIPRRPFHLLVGLYLLAWIPAWIYEVVRTDLLLEPTYGLLRNALAVGVAIPVAMAIRRRRDMQLFILVLALGTIVTAALAVAQVTPGLQGPVQELLATLAPNFAPSAYRVYPERAFALFTAPTGLSGYLAVTLPIFIAGLSIATKGIRRVLILAIAAVALALIATYSRQWAPALAIGLLVLALVRPQGLGRTTLIGAAAAALVIVALATNVLDSGYFTERFSRLGTNDRNVQTRLDRQREFFAVTKANAASADTIFGRGFAGQDIAARDLADVKTTEDLQRGVSDNSFLLEFFNHGLAAGLLYIAILLAVLRQAVRKARRPGPYSALLGGLVASLSTAIALHFFDRYFSESVFMKMQLWMLIGFTLAVCWLARSESAAEDGASESAK